MFLSLLELCFAVGYVPKQLSLRVFPGSIGTLVTQGRLYSSDGFFPGKKPTKAPMSSLLDSSKPDLFAISFAMDSYLRQLTKMSKLLCDQVQTNNCFTRVPRENENLAEKSYQEDDKLDDGSQPDQEQTKPNSVEESYQENNRGASDIQKTDSEQDTPTNHSLIDKIVRAADPLYPITEKDVQSILDVYTAFPNRPIEGITNVLIGRTNTPKSAIFCSIGRYVIDKGSSLDEYRKTYAKLSKALDGNAMSVMRKIMLKRTKNEDSVHNTSSSGSTELTKPKNLDRMESREEESPDGGLSLSKGKYSITVEEQKLLNEVYRLLPHVNAKYVARVLSGKTKTPSTPTYKAVIDVINKIREREEKSGIKREEEITLDYFRRLHWSSVRVTGRSRVNIEGEDSNNIREEESKLDVSDVDFKSDKEKKQSKKEMRQAVIVPIKKHKVILEKKTMKKIKTAKK